MAEMINKDQIVGFDWNTTSMLSYRKTLGIILIKCSFDNTIFVIMIYVTLFGIKASRQGE